MGFVSSAIRYRPQQWGEVLGQDVTVRILQNAVLRQRIASAYIFEGQRGCGKTTIARLLAMTINCMDRGGLPEPCGTCASCRSIAEGRDDEVLEMDAASNRGIDDARRLRAISQQQPRSGASRIVIIDEAHQLTKEAQGALLALFENPPSRFLPILCTTDAEKILPTIRSRCSTFQIRPLSDSAICSSLRRIFQDAGQPVEDSVMFALARSSGGSLRDVQQTADQLIVSAGGSLIDDEFAEKQSGIATTSLFLSVAGAMALAWEEGPRVWFETIADLHSDGVDMRLVYFYVVPTLLRDLRISLVSRGMPQPVVPYDSGIPHEIFEAKNRFTHEDIGVIFQAWDEHAQYFGQLHERANVEHFFIKAWDRRGPHP